MVAIEIVGIGDRCGVGTGEIGHCRNRSVAFQLIDPSPRCAGCCRAICREQFLCLCPEKFSSTGQIFEAGVLPPTITRPEIPALLACHELCIAIKAGPSQFERQFILREIKSCL